MANLKKEQQAHADDNLLAEREHKKKDETIAHLKNELELNQINYIHDQDKSNAIISEMHKDLLILRSDNERIGVTSG